jgi:hypothetical protein
MTKRVLVLSATTVVLLVGLTLSADASMLTGVSGLPTLTQGYSPVEHRAIHLLKVFGAFADRVDAPATAGFGAAGGTGVAACVAGGGRSPQPR